MSFRVIITRLDLQSVQLALNKISDQISHLLNRTISGVTNTVYGDGWKDDTATAPSRNAVYDELETHYADGDAHHDETHTIVSHDTDATGAQLTELTDGSTTSLHNHAGGAGEANTASSAGSGTSVYYQKTGVDLEFNAIKSESNKLGVALDGATHDIELTVNEGNIDHDALTNTHNLSTDIDHAGLTNAHNLSTDIDHNGLTNTHNLTTDIDHDALTNFAAGEHFTEGSIDHTAITNIGTNTHAQIDTFIGTTYPAHTGSADAHHAEAHTLTSHSDVTITTPADNEVLAYDGVSDFINQTAAEAGLATAGHDHDADYDAIGAAAAVAGDLADHEAVVTGNPHVVTLAEVGGEAAGTAAGLIATHTSDVDAHHDNSDDHAEVHTLTSHGDVTITTPADNEVLAYDGVSDFINQTPAEAGLALAGHDHDSDYAAIADGVTNGDSHDHSGGDGAQIDHGGLAGLADDDHTQYLNTTRGDARYYDQGTADATFAPINKGVTNGDSHNHAGGDGGALDTAAVTTGTFDDARISESSVTQHEAALSILGSQLDLKPAVFTDATGAQIVSNSAVTATLDTTSVADANYTLGSNVITLNSDGDYMICFHAGFLWTSAGATRTGVTGWLETDTTASYVAIPGSHACAYSRYTGASTNSGGVSNGFVPVLDQNNGDTIRLRLQGTASTAVHKTVASRVSVSIIKIGA